MKAVLSVLTFIAVYTVARISLAFLGLSAVVQLLGGVAAGILAARPVWAYYSSREAQKVVRGIFGGDADAPRAAAGACVACDADLGPTTQSMLAQSRRLTFCPACGAPLGS